MSGHCDVFNADHGPIREIAGAAGIDLRGDGLAPWHCGVQMSVRSGIAGPDHVHCQTCGLTIGNGLSPHINGGRFLGDDVFDAHPEGAWIVIGTPPTPEVTDAAE